MDQPQTIAVTDAIVKAELLKLERVVSIVALQIRILGTVQRTTAGAAPQGEQILAELANVAGHRAGFRGARQGPGIVAQIALDTLGHETPGRLPLSQRRGECAQVAENECAG